jgi:hypothetical protein
MYWAVAYGYLPGIANQKWSLASNGSYIVAADWTDSYFDVTLPAPGGMFMTIGIRSGGSTTYAKNPSICGTIAVANEDPTGDLLWWT